MRWLERYLTESSPAPALAEITASLAKRDATDSLRVAPRDVTFQSAGAAVSASARTIVGPRPRRLRPQAVPRSRAPPL